MESDHLYNLLSRLSLDNLPSRRPLIKALVITGSVINSEETRQRMYKLVGVSELSTSCLYKFGKDFDVLQRLYNNFSDSRAACSQIPIVMQQCVRYRWRNCSQSIGGFARMFCWRRRRRSIGCSPGAFP